MASDERKASRSTHDRSRIMLRPITNPLPLTFLMTAGGTLFLAVEQLDLVKGEEDLSVLAFALVGFAFPLHLVAAIFGFLGRDPVGALMSSVLSGTWLVSGLVLLALPTEGSNAGFGVFFLVVAVLLVAPAVSASTTKLLPAIVLAALSIRFGIGGVAELLDADGLKKVAGVVGLLIAAAAAYTGVALALEDVKRREILPLGRHGEGQEAMEAPIEDQLRDAEKDAGVRRAL